MTAVLYGDRPNAIRSKNRLKWKRAKERRSLARLAAEVPRPIPTRGEMIMARYQRLNFAGRVKFALDGYRFEDGSDGPAIKIFKTNIRTAAGLDRGIVACNEMPRLPKGFMVLLSWHTESRTPTREYPQCMYQLELPGGRHLFLHTQPLGHRGLGNFINAAVDIGGRNRVAYQNALLHETDQDMRVAQCKYTVANTKIGKVMLIKYPVYVTVLKDIPAGHELLMPKRYGSGRAYMMPMP